jgi:hypothetical protein
MNVTETDNRVVVKFEFSVAQNTFERRAWLILPQSR